MRHVGKIRADYNILFRKLGMYVKVLENLTEGTMGA